MRFLILQLKKKEIGLPPSTPSEEERGARVFMSRDFSLKPMSVEEALLHLESTNREVFVFRKFDSEKWAVLYRSKDGNYGLVEPE